MLTLTKPVTVAATNAYILFNEIALVEYNGANIKDFIVVEGSNDEGQTWHALTNPYAANSKSEWKNVFDTGAMSLLIYSETDLLILLPLAILKLGIMCYSAFESLPMQRVTAGVGLWTT